MYYIFTLSVFLHADTLKRRGYFIFSVFLHYLSAFLKNYLLSSLWHGTSCVPKQITGIQLEISHLSFLVQWPE